MRILLVSDMHFGISQTTKKIWDKYWKSSVEKEQFDLVIAAGDIGTARLSHYETGIRFLSERAEGRPVLAVRGNHDFWDRGRRNFLATIRRQEEIALKYNVLLLEGTNKWENDEIRIIGWDGWYAHNPFGVTNDFNHMPDHIDNSTTVDEFMRKREYGHLSGVLDQTNCHHKIVAVTHMPCLPGIGNPRYNANVRHGEMLMGKVDVICFGHSHERLELQIGRTRVLNAGSDYDKPNHMIFEV